MMMTKQIERVRDALRIAGFGDDSLEEQTGRLMRAMGFRQTKIIDVDAITTWQAETFGAAPGVRKAAIFAHLLEEVGELEQAIQGSKTTTLERLAEMADVVILLAALAHAHGGCLADAVAEKMARNRARTWKAPDERGVVHHETEAPDADLV